MDLMETRDVTTEDLAGAYLRAAISLGADLEPAIEALRVAVEEKATQMTPPTPRADAPAPLEPLERRLLAAIMVWPALLRIERSAGRGMELCGAESDAVLRPLARQTFRGILRVARTGSDPSQRLGEAGIELRQAVAELLSTLAEPSLPGTVTFHSPAVRRLHAAAEVLGRVCPLAGLAAREPADEPPAEVAAEEVSHG